MSIFKQLTDVNEQTNELEKEIKIKVAGFNETIELDKAKLQDLKDKEKVLREEVYEILENTNEERVSIDDKIITRNVKETPFVASPNILKSAIEHARKEFEDVDVDVDHILENGFENKLEVNKPLVSQTIEKYFQLTGKHLEGVEIKSTKYLTIRTNDTRTN